MREARVGLLTETPAHRRACCFRLRAEVADRRAAACPPTGERRSEHRLEASERGSSPARATRLSNLPTTSCVGARACPSMLPGTPPGRDRKERSFADDHAVT